MPRLMSILRFFSSCLGPTGSQVSGFFSYRCCTPGFKSLQGETLINEVKMCQKKSLEFIDLKLKMHMSFKIILLLLLLVNSYYDLKGSLLIQVLLPSLPHNLNCSFYPSLPWQSSDTLTSNDSYVMSIATPGRSLCKKPQLQCPHPNGTTPSDFGLVSDISNCPKE